MAKLQHVNLHEHGDLKDVYAALQRDFDRDTWRHLFWHVVLAASAGGAVWIANQPDWLWLFAGLYAVERAVARAVDNSNRNWAMHLIDWQEARERQKASLAYDASMNSDDA